MDLTTLGGRLKAARESKGLSLRALAEKLGMDNSTISKIESNAKGTTEETAKKFGKALGTTAAWLLRGEGEGPKLKAEIDKAEAESAVAYAVRGAGHASAAIDFGDGGELILCSYHELVRSTFNPRTIFEDESLAELAESIAANGILQNLVARPRNPDAEISVLNPLEIVAGERRYRAVEILVKAKRWNAETKNIPVLKKALSEAQARAFAILENLQRVNVHPLDEGEALLTLNQLDPKAWSTAAMAKTLGKSPSYIQKRIRLARGLDDEVKESFRAGKIQLDQAQHLVMATADRQREIAKGIAKGEYAFQTGEDVRNQITRKLIPQATAIFPLKLYTGATVEDQETDPPTIYFADVALFERLQDDAIAEKIAELKAEWKWVRQDTWFQESAYETTDDRTKGGAIVVVDHKRKVTIHTGLIDRRGERGNERIERETARSSWEQQVGTIYAELEAKIRSAIDERPLVAKRAFVLALLVGGDNWHSWIPEPISYDDFKTLEPLLRPIFGDMLKIDEDGAGIDGTPENLWLAMERTPEETLDRIFVTAISNDLRIYGWYRNDRVIGPEGEQILKALSIDAPTIPPKPDDAQPAEASADDDGDDELPEVDDEEEIGEEAAP